MTTHVSVRELRAALKTYLDNTEAVILGDTYRPRAVLIPLNLPTYPERYHRKKAAEQLKKAANRIAKELAGGDTSPAD